MHIKTKARIRRRHPSKNLPGELAGRLQSLHDHRNLREQRDTFTSVHKHPGGTYRWNAHLLALPHCHIIESESYGKKLRIHIYHARSGNILTIELNEGKWIRKSLTPEDRIQDTVPQRYCRTGWLAKSASRSQVKAVARITGIQKHALPGITAANANVIIHSAELLQHIDTVTPLLVQWVIEIQSENHKHAI